MIPYQVLAAALQSVGPKALWTSEAGVVLNDFWQVLTNVTASGPNNRGLTKTGGGAGWDAGGSSCVALPGDGCVEFRTDSTHNVFGGLSSVNPDAAISVNFAFYTSGVNVNIYELSMDKGRIATDHTAADVFRVQRSGTVITYWRNAGAGWVLLYTSLTASVEPLVFDSSFFDAGAALYDVEFFGGTYQNAVNVSVVGNVITKSNAPGWDAGARSNATLPGDGWVEFSTLENNLSKVAGLSHCDPDQNYTTIEYGLDLNFAGSVIVYEMGVSIGAVSTYVANDRFRVRRTGTAVVYQQLILGTWTTIYASLVACPTGSLMFDSSVGHTAGTLVLVDWNGAEGLSGVSTNGPWQNVANVGIVGGTITKLTADGWDAGASSSFAIVDDGWVDWTTAELSLAKCAGLSAADAGVGYATVNYGFMLCNSAINSIRIFEGGVDCGVVATYLPGDIFRVQRVGTTVTYWQLAVGVWTLLYTSLVPSTGPLLFDVGCYSIGATVRLVDWSGESKRCFKLLDLAYNGYDVAAPYDVQQPLWVTPSGAAPYLLFDKLRGDTLTTAALMAIGANPYTLVAVYRWRSSPGAEVNSTLIQMGNFGADGFLHCLNEASGQELLYRGYGAVVQLWSPWSSDQLPHSVILRNFGSTADWSQSGVPFVTVASSAQVAPTTGTQIGAYTGTYKADMDLYALVLFDRALTNAEVITLDRLIQQHYDLYSPTTVAPTPLVGYRGDKGLYINGGKVQRWLDQMPGANNLVQATAAKRPVQFVDADGHSCVRFTAATWNVMSATVLALPADYSVFMVKRHRTAVGAWCGSWGNCPVALGDGMSDMQAANKRALAHHGIANGIWNDQVLTIEACTWRYNLAGTSADLNINGVDKAPTAENGAIAATGNLNVGGAISDGTLSCDVDIYEFWVWDRRLTNVEVAELSAYARVKYGTEWTPADLAPLVGYSSDHVTTVFGGEVIYWADRMNTGNDLEEAAGGKPEYVLDGLYYTVRFVAANSDTLVGPVVPLISDYTVFMMCRYRSVPGAWDCGWANSSEILTTGQGDRGGTVGKRGLAHWGSDSCSWDDDSLLLESLIWRYDHAGVSAALRASGVDKGAHALDVQNAPVGTLQLGAATLAGGQATDVDVYEWWAWDRRLTDAEVAELDAHVRVKYRC